MCTLEIISTTASVVTALSAGLIWWQIRSDHERSRRENSLTYLFEWTNSIKKETMTARKIVDTLDRDNATKLQNIEPILVSLTYKTLLESCLQSTSLEVLGSHFKLNESQTAILRWYVISYLNSLETVLTGWRYSIVDKDIIEDEFQYLYDKKKKYAVLHDFRSVVGEESYPSIKLFCDHLQKKNEQVITSKSNIA